ncbi:hypothetical protein lerEdw1_007390 [Lerista edwardsae]|nr:hypothetical protein lerEdw1_007390 [Lerista edwardsae]
MRSLMSLVVLLLIEGQCCLGCAVDEEQRPLVTYLLNKMIQSTTAPKALPNPSILLALRLARDHSLITEKRLLKQLSKDAVDLVQNQIHGSPLTNYYQLGLCVLTLCQLQGRFSPSQIANLFIPEEKKYTLGDVFSVDTAALAVLAQICVQTTDNAIPPEANKTITANVHWLLKKILEQKSTDGVIGNFYSTGEAMQMLARILTEIPKGTFNNPMAAAQLVPSLEGRTYLDVKTIDCSKDAENLTLTTPPPTTPQQSTHSITVTYTVTDSVDHTFTYSTTVSVPMGSVFLTVMKAAQKEDPEKFRYQFRLQGDQFTYEQTTWGPYITSVRGLKADNSKRTYWQLLSGNTPLSTALSPMLLQSLLGLAVSINNLPLGSPGAEGWLLRAVPAEQQWLVTDLQTQLVNSVNPQGLPDPSILIALNLAGDQNSNVKKQLVQQLKETATKEIVFAFLPAEMTSGKVALYVLALRSSCENLDVTTPGNNVNLVHVLEEKTKEELNYFYDHGTPKTTFYQLALDTLALCVEKSPEVEMAAITLAKAALANDFVHGEYFSVDTAAMASLALTCVYDGILTTQQSKIVGAIQEALARITKQILGEQQSSGIIGNIYSTGLAMQALSVTSEFYVSGAWSCVKTLDKVLNEINLGVFSNPAAASQILPSLVGKTYLDVKSITCSSENVHYTIINDLVGSYFKYSITVNVPKDSVLLAVLEAAQRAKPSEFSFETEETSWGPMVVSINGIRASTNEKTYWQFFSGKTSLQQGTS